MSFGLAPWRALASARARRWRRRRARASAAITAERVSSSSQNICAARCFSAWKVPIATPNCLRVLQILRACARTPRAALPSISAASPARARSSTRSSRSAPPSTAPSTASAADLDVVEADDRGVAAVDHDGARARHAGRVAGTRNSVMPSRSPASPAVRAATIERSATWPSSTKVFSPRQPIAAAVALRRASRSRVGAWRVPSSSASANERARRRRARQMLVPSARRCRPAPARSRRAAGREQRRRGSVRPARLQHQAEPDVAEARAAVLLGDQEAGPAELRHLAPQRRARSRRRRCVVAQLAERA